MEVTVNPSEADPLPPPSTYTLELSEKEMFALATLLYWQEPGTPGCLFRQLPRAVRSAVESIPQRYVDAVIRQFPPADADVMAKAIRLVRGMAVEGE